MKFEETVNYMDIEFLVSGDWQSYVRGRGYMENGDPGYPDEGGYFEDMKIMIGDQDVTDALAEQVIIDIERLAEEMAAELTGEPSTRNRW
jgi:hypothetical protein